ncbi:PKD domain-containing protein [uncultured Arcticibacterium sp.]|uniref:PKD domain-containing protein n=1 Tax=uncultured Arcticibacterium sp. TaxID=2173042 RepID=UPI0030F8CB05
MLTYILVFLGFLSAEKDTVSPPISKYGHANSISAGNPVSLKSDVSVQANYSYVENNSVRIVYDSVNQVFYTNTFGGDIYRIRVINGVPQYRELFIPSSQHLINRMQGLMFYNSALYIVGNEADDANKRGRGRVIKVSFDSNGNNKAFTYMLGTEYYASSTTLFDHAFSAITLNAAKDSLYIASGSRTDHGEVKDVGGMYPNLRDEPLTTKIFAIPITANNIYLLNDETWLQNSGYIYCEGVRNEFDMALNAKGELFGVENMGDRDDPEELNLLKRGKHYGFPWRMGGNITPQQFTPYDPSTDKLLPSNLGFPEVFHNDSTFPVAPNIAFEEPIPSIGPDANWVRNPVSGVFEQKDTITTFTSHRSPLGFNIDVDSVLAYPYNASGFVLAYTEGNGPSGYLNSVDPGADLCQIKFLTDQNTGKYIVQVIRLVKDFDRVVDAVLVGTEMYVLEETGHIHKVSFQALQAPVPSFTSVIDEECKLKVNFTTTSIENYETVYWDFGDGSISTDVDPTHQYANSGSKNVSLTLGNAAGSNFTVLNVNIPTLVSLSGNSVETKVSGIEKIETTQNVQNQELFAKKSIQMNTGFQTLPGAVFSSKIAEGCQ